MGAKPKEQLGMDDVVVVEPELEEMLEKRQSLKPGAAAYRKADKEAKVKISSLTHPTPYRVGRFVIAKATTPPRSVAFDVMAGDRITIKTLGEEEE